MVTLTTLQWLHRAILQLLLVRLRSKLSMAALWLIIAGTVRSSASRQSHVLIYPLIKVLHSCAASWKLALTVAVDLIRILVATGGAGRSIRLHF